MSPEAVARIGLSALAKNKSYVIAGIINRIMSGTGSLVSRAAGRNMWGGLVRGIVPRELSVR